jgi:AraC family transcriptional regulator
MSITTLHIKNMVCPRCVESVRTALGGIGIDCVDVELGAARVNELSHASMPEIRTALERRGFSLIEDPVQKTVEGIKVALIEYVANLENADSPELVSSYLSHQLALSYEQISRQFSKSENMTIERYVILLKIERGKELVSYGELTLSEIAYRLKYSSVQHLSAQFKSITGSTVSEFKAGGAVHRHSLDSISSVRSDSSEHS